MLKKYSKNKGFTLVEILVAMGIFSIMIGSATTILSTTLKGQRKALAVQQTVDQISFALEYISRSVRMAQAGTLEITTRGGLTFANSNGEIQEIYLDSGQLKQLKGTEIMELTSNNIEIATAVFREGSGLQPEITIALTVRSNGLKEEQNVKIQLQTSISQRNF